MSEVALREGPPGELQFAFRLERRHNVPGHALDPESVHHDIMGFLGRLADLPEGARQCDARFALQCYGAEGELQLALIVAVREDGSGDARLCPDMLCASLLDIFAVETPWLRVVPVDASNELARILGSAYAIHVAELARRDEPCDKAVLRFGTNADPGPEFGVEGLWRLWLLTTRIDDRRRPAEALVEQEHPICIRVLVRPTQLTAGELAALDQIIKGARPLVEGVSSLRGAVGSLTKLVGQQQLFEGRFQVASPAPVDRELLEVLGQAVSEPSRNGTVLADRLVSGFEVLTDGLGLDHDEAVRSFGDLAFDNPLPTNAPPTLRRMRSVFGTWEMAKLFNLPVARPWQREPSQRQPPHPTRELSLVGDMGEVTADEVVRTICLACPDILPIQARAVVNGLPGSSPFGLQLDSMEVANIRRAVERHGLRVDWSL